MATATAAHTDKDLASMSEARALARRARAAQTILAEFSQPQIDAIVDAMAAAVRPHAEALARLAVEETGFGVVADKVQKNLFAADRVHAFIKPMTTVGVVRRDDVKKVVEIAEPFGVVAAIVPSTNPTSTAIYKLLICLKARCAVIVSPHPSAARCITRTVEIMHEAARGAGLPDGAIGCMGTVTLEGTQELMKAREVSVILATGGMGLVRAAYSAGKPAYGVGPGNAPCYIESSADVNQAARDIVSRQELRQRRAVLVAELGGGRSRRGRGSPPRFCHARRALPQGARRPTPWPRCSSPLSACPTRRWSASRRSTSPGRSASACRPAPAPCSWS